MGGWYTCRSRRVDRPKISKVMPYKNREDRLAHSKKYGKTYYHKHKDVILARTRKANKITKKRNREFLNGLREAVGCLECDVFSTPALDFHHVDPGTKKGHLSDMASGSFAVATLAAEVRKCVVLCKNHHAEYHAKVLRLPKGAIRAQQKLLNIFMREYLDGQMSST